ncbi:MAG: hypothetical protein HUJ29_07935 [Gammaproteobacteria bacterium]|nr:hypothetical protein [Gammaproteobacteria bacterium]
MVQFDQAYIPTLVLTYDHNRRAMAAMETLFDAWSVYKQKHAYTSSTDLALNFDLNRIEWHVLEARRMLLEQQQQAAYETLLPIREIFMAIRERQQHDYYIDALNRYHEFLSDLVQGDLKDGLAIKEQYSRLVNMWLDSIQKEINPYKYGLNMERYQQFIERRDEHLKKLIALDETLRNGDREALMNQLSELETGIFEILARFGRFPSQTASAA